jgi:hypothetical protein
MRLGSKAEKGAESRPFQQHARLVANGVAVVLRRDVVNVVRSEVEYRGILELRAEPTRKHDPNEAALEQSPPTMGRMCVDHLQPGSWTERPTVKSPRSTRSSLIPGSRSVSSGVRRFWNGPPYRPMVNPVAPKVNL